MERPTILIDAWYDEEEVLENTPWASEGDDDDDARSFFSVDDVEKPGDVIPRQSIFLARTLELIRAADDTTAEVARGVALMTLMEHLLRPEYAPFHRAYPVWRRVANERCAAFLEEVTEAALREQCIRFTRLFPI